MIFAATLNRLRTRIARAMENSAAVRELQSMTDHQLRDIGINRDQIEAFVHGEITREARPAVRSSLVDTVRNLDAGPIPRAYVH